MGEAQIRTTYDWAFTFQVTAPASGGSYASLQSLLTGAQVTEMANYLPCSVAMFAPTVGVNYEHVTPGGSVVSPNSQPFPINANQKPNEMVPCIRGLERIFVRSTGVATQLNLTINCVSKDTL